MRKRPALNCERLERRELPAGSLGVGILSPDPAHAAPLEAQAQTDAHGLQPAGLGQELQSSVWESTLSSDAVGAFFARRDALSGVFPPTVDEAAAPTFDDSEFESLPSPGWDTDAAPIFAAALPRVSDAQVWTFVRNYATKAIRREEFARGPLPDHADIIQQIYVEWREGVSARDDVHSRLLDKESPERSVFRGAVRRVLDRTRYDTVKQRRRAELDDQPEAPSKPSRDWADVEIDLTQGVGKLTAREREMLDLRRLGATFEEIGAKLGMSKQRVCEAYNELLDRLTAIYRD
jgi:DNA-directed RNA polymerase specialized sigma24 family protein